ncbi:hypothetical protein PLACP1_19610 [Planifilum fimeticola]
MKPGDGIGVGSIGPNPPNEKILRHVLLFLAGSGGRGMSKDAFHGRMGGDNGDFRRSKTVEI